jgi:hypothetical protein
MPEGKFEATLRRFCESRIEFILVGGLAAVLQGAPVQTFDVDLVYERAPANVDRLAAVLQSLDAVFRIQPELRLRPTRDHLAGGGHLKSRDGSRTNRPSRNYGANLGYADLLPHSTELEVSPGIRVRVLNLETLISIKEQLASEKDIAMLPLLRRTLDEIRKKKIE